MDKTLYTTMYKIDSNGHLIVENLQIGGNLDLSNTAITNYPVVYNCGNEDRAIYLDLKDKSLIRIGCFKGTQEAVSKRYSGGAKEAYISKIKECFKL